MNVNVGHKRRFNILRRDGFRCCTCGRGPRDGVHLEVDHIVPTTQGGQDIDGNLWTLCYDCNRGAGRSMKSHSSLESDHTELEELTARINRLLAINEKAATLAEALEAGAQDLDRYWWRDLAGQPQWGFGEPTLAVLKYFLHRGLSEMECRECMALVWEQYHDPKRIRPAYRLMWRSIERSRR
jgi:hypothetical protein